MRDTRLTWLYGRLDALREIAMIVDGGTLRHTIDTRISLTQDEIDGRERVLYHQPNHVKDLLRKDQYNA